MSNLHDGGPAFPGSVSADDSGGLNHGPPGMTLRDYFAAKAMQAFMVCSLDQRINDDADTKEKAAAHYARTAYLVADAMLAERKK